MSNSKPSNTSARWVVLVTMGLLVLVGGVFLIEFVRASQRQAPPAETLTADSYLADVTPLLANADPAHGAALIQKYECHICHIEAGNKIAPAFTGISQRAGTRRPPLVAQAYIYESITNPGAFLAPKPASPATDGAATPAPTTYANAMPANYKTRLAPQDIGDIIAYLLTQ